MEDNWLYTHTTTESGDLTTEALNIFFTMGQYETQSLNRDGVTDLQIYLKRLFENEGMHCRLIESQDKRFAPLLVARREGISKESITFIAHADMVSPNTNFTIDNSLLVGAGSADNRISLAMLVLLARLLKGEMASFYSIEFVISPNEEMGSVGHLEHFQKLKKKTRYVFGMEPSPGAGKIIHSRNGNRWYKVFIEGIASHAGRLDDASLNAAHELFKKYQKLEELVRDRSGVRLNIGALETPFKSFNTVCGSVTAKIDFRFNSPLVRDELHQKFIQIFESSQSFCQKTNAGTQCLYSIEDDCPPMKQSEIDITLKLFLSREVARSDGETLSLVHTGGAADINYFSKHDNICLDGLGAIGGKLHTREEFVEIASIAPRIQLLKSLISYLHKQRTILC